MEMFVFRNNTVEPFFPKDYVFSGYNDISVIPSDAAGYVWFYQVPFKYDQQFVANEIDAYVSRFVFLLTKIEATKDVLAVTMDLSFVRPFSDNDRRVAQAVMDFNRALYDAEAKYQNVKVIDISEFTCQYPTDEIIDWKFFFLSQIPLNPRLKNDFLYWWMRKLDSIALVRKKCLVLDLDNTLWGGVLGEDGNEGIMIGGDYPGNAFLSFQEALLELSRNGVILTVCSKNDEQTVLDAWEKNPFMVLRKEHFSAFRINWNNKDINIKEIAKELNIGLDSMVFVDDNPAERELIKQMLPAVSVPDFPDHPYLLPRFFNHLVAEYFNVYRITDEDKEKTAQYQANAARNLEKRSFTNFTDYLRSLSIQICIEPANAFNVPRISQMTQKTNQFNLTTRRYTDADVKRFLAEGWRVWCMDVADKFGDSGITGCIMITPDYVIDNLLLSCRVLGKGVEQAFVKTILSIMRNEGVFSLKADYFPSSKNEIAACFYDALGFKHVSTETDGAKHYVADLTELELMIEDYYCITVK